MKLKKSVLKRIIREEIERGTLSESSSESEQERRDRWREHAKSGKPDLEEPGYADFKKGFLSVYNPGKYVADSISGNFQDEPEDEQPEGDPDFVDDIMASYYLFWVKGLTKGVLKGPIGDSPSEIISAGYAIVMAGEGQLDTFQLFSPEFWGKDKNLPNVKDLNGNRLSGCEATAMILVAGAIYKKMYQAYAFLGNRADRVLGARLRSLIGRRRFLAISPGLTGDDVKEILSLALTLKTLRDHQPTAEAITDLTQELCSIKDIDSGYRAVERIIIKFVYGTPDFVMDVYDDLVDQLNDTKQDSDSSDSTDADDELI